MSKNIAIYKDITKHVKALFGCVTIIVSFWLSVNAYVASSQVDTPLEKIDQTSFFLSSTVKQDADLAALIGAEAKGLEFMVWDHERRVLSQQLAGFIKKRINLDSFNGSLWQQLIYVQKDAGVSMSERAWSIERASKLDKWNFESRSKIASYCITEYQAFQKVSAQLCSSLIANLPRPWPDKLIAEKANVKLTDLQAAVQAVKKLDGSKPRKRNRG